MCRQPAKHINPQTNCRNVVRGARKGSVDLARVLEVDEKYVETAFKHAIFCLVLIDTQIRLDQLYLQVSEEVDSCNHGRSKELIHTPWWSTWSETVRCRNEGALSGVRRQMYSLVLWLKFLFNFFLHWWYPRYLSQSLWHGPAGKGPS